MQALSELAANPPSVEGLPAGDFWSILGKYMSRGFAASGSPRTLCEEHLGARYRSQWGAPDNFQRLVDDLRAYDPDGRLAVSTVGSCWTNADFEDCIRCADTTISYIYNPIKPGEKSNELADVWRQAYRAEHPSDLTLLEDYASDMFPAIEFSQVAWNQLNTLIGAPEESVASVINHLAVLNDSAAELWKNQITPQGRQAAMGAQGVTASLEGPKTHKNIKAMNMRDFQFQQGKARCEWHTKLRPEINRIYFAVVEERVLVGVIVDHLPT